MEIKPLNIKEIKEYKLDKIEIEKSILESLNISADPEAFNRITFNWEIEDNKAIGLFLETEKIIG